MKRSVVVRVVKTFVFDEESRFRKTDDEDLDGVVEVPDGDLTVDNLSVGDALHFSGDCATSELLFDGTVISIKEV